MCRQKHTRSGWLCGLSLDEMKIQILITIVVIALNMMAQIALCSPCQYALDDYLAANEKGDWISVFNALERKWLNAYGIYPEVPETVDKAVEYLTKKDSGRAIVLTCEPQILNLESYTIYIYSCDIKSRWSNQVEYSTGFITATLHKNDIKCVFLDSALVGEGELKNIYSEIPTNQYIPPVIMIKAEDIQHAPPGGRGEAPRP